MIHNPPCCLSDHKKPQQHFPFLILLTRNTARASLCPKIYNSLSSGIHNIAYHKHPVHRLVLRALEARECLSAFKPLLYYRFTQSRSSCSISAESTASPAVSVRRIRCPSVIGRTPFSCAYAISASSKPPSGPIRIAADVPGCTFARIAQFPALKAP